MAVIDEQAKKRFKRRLRRGRKETIASVAQADEQIEKLLIRRFDRLVSVRRFVIAWSLLFVALAAVGYWQLKALTPYYQSLQPVPGGLYSEGLIGSFTNADPLFASGEADTAVSHLVFSGLFKYDNNNNLVGDLATGYSLSDNQLRYTVHLRHNVRWQDGKPFTADDVIFTYKTIQNVEAQSPLYSSWQGITLSKLDNYTVAFDLPNALSAFPHSLTNGIVPEHLLARLPAEQLRSASFNTAPVGTGPFVWRFIEVTGVDNAHLQQRLSFAPYKNYYAGAPKLDGFSILTYADDQQLIGAFAKKQLNAMVGLEDLPAGMSSDKSIHVYRTPLTAAVMTFFNNSRAGLSDPKVRLALSMAVDRSQLSHELGYQVRLVNGPLLSGQLGYDPAIVEAGYNLTAANQLLDQDGWVRDASGQRVKDGKPLVFTLSAQSTVNYTKVAQFLQQQWAKLGARVEPSYSTSDDIQASVIGSHDYDILLYGITIGVDPDVFAYWDSSQASLTSQGHLNLSEYKSSAADQALEAARTRADPTLRAVKLKAFLNAWVADAPALALYQPDFVYITRGPIFNYQRLADNSSVDRFYNVANWEVRQQHQTLK